MPGRKKQTQKAAAKPRAVPQFQRGQEVVFSHTGKLTGIVKEVKTGRGETQYLIYANLAFATPEGRVLCLVADAAEVLGKREAKKLNRSYREWWPT